MQNTNTNTALKSVPASPRARVKRTRKVVKSATAVGIVDQVKLAFQAGNLIATAIGFLLGGVIPLFTYMIAHSLGTITNPLIVLVAGGLAYSAPTVYQWGAKAFQSRYKSIGFVILIEGCMTLAPQAWIAITALVYLIMINGVATGVTLALGQRK